MIEHAISSDILVILLAAVVSALVARQFRLPSIIGYVLAGMVIGPFSLGFVDDVVAIERVGEFGVAFLLFAVGLELPFDRLRVMREGILGLGLGQLLASSVILGLAAFAFGVSPAGAFIIGAALAMSSTAIVLQILIDRRELNSRIGRATLAVLLTQDLAVGPLLAIALAIGSQQFMQADAGYGLAIIQPVLGVLLIIAIGRLVMRPLFRPVAATRNPDLFSAATLLIVLSIGWLTERAGLSMVFGAFLAGMLLADSTYRHQVAAVMQPFRGLLLGLFFITVGMSMDLNAVAENIWLLLALVLALLLSKAMIVVGLGLVFKYNLGGSLYLALLLAPSGEFAFALLGAGLTQSTISSQAGQLLISAVGLSMLVAPLLAQAGRWLYVRFERAQSMTHLKASPEEEDLADHVVIAGFGRVGQAIARRLKAQGIPLVAIDSDPDIVTEGKKAGFNVFYGDAALPEVMVALRVEQARALVVALGDPRLALQLVTLLRYIFPNLKIFARAYDDAQMEALNHAGADRVVSEFADAAAKLAGQVVSDLAAPPAPNPSPIKPN